MNVKEKILKKIIRVDQAGELGAQQIYQGQKMIFKLQKNKKDFDQISKMAKDEEEHLVFFDNIAKEKKIRPTKLKGLFGIGAYAMGVGTALMGPKAAYVCTEAVEEIIEKLQDLEGVGICRLGYSDIQRNGILGKILKRRQKILRFHHLIM